METNRRSFVKAAGIAAVACGAMSASGLASTLQTRPFSNIKALAFDAYGRASQIAVAAGRLRTGTPGMRSDATWS